MHFMVSECFGDFRDPFDHLLMNCRGTQLPSLLYFQESSVLKRCAEVRWAVKTTNELRRLCQTCDLKMVMNLNDSRHILSFLVRDVTK